MQVAHGQEFGTRSSFYTSFTPHGHPCAGCTLSLQAHASPEAMSRLVLLRGETEASVEMLPMPGVTFREVGGSIDASVMVRALNN